MRVLSSSHGSAWRTWRRQAPPIEREIYAEAIARAAGDLKLATDTDVVHYSNKYSSKIINKYQDDAIFVRFIVQLRQIEMIKYWLSPVPLAQALTEFYHFSICRDLGVSSKHQSTRQDESNEPKLDGLRRLITEFLWPPSSSIIRLWLPYSTKVLVKTNQTSPNSMELRRLITEFLWPPSSSIIRLWLPYSTKVLGKTNQTSPNSMELRRLITEFLWPPSSSIIRLWLPYSTKVLARRIKRAQTRWGCVV
ncbi:hypothetical protein EVAR_92857_1 [Eumeta japonica]|uniref:Uncharacterized protein n=1 Tax=Eumeta variegata TaxID=151549 RepID=A0A4C1TAY2_EUMVA|nr:hypothetical protein EVAR_92857_1 [Eumeta japonica]